MKNNPFVIALYFIWLGLNGISLQAQTLEHHYPVSSVPDTIFVYDTIYITDTIRIARPLKRELKKLPPANLAEIKSAGASGDQLFDILPDTPATLFKNSIIQSADIIQLKKADSMKKIGFWGAALFTLPGMMLAQNNFYVSAGTGAYQINPNTEIKSQIAPAIYGGIGYRRDLAGDKLSIGVELNYARLLHPTFDASRALLPVGIPANHLFNQKIYNRNYHLLSLPVALRLQTKSLSPRAGLEVYYRQSRQFEFFHANSLPQVDTGGGVVQLVVPNLLSSTGSSGQILSVGDFFESSGIAIRDKQLGASWFVGLDLSLSEQMAVSLNYYQGLTRESMNDFQGRRVSTQLQRMEIRLQYRIF